MGSSISQCTAATGIWDKLHKQTDPVFTSLYVQSCWTVFVWQTL